VAKVQDESEYLGDVICLYERSGFAAQPWAAAGYRVWCYDSGHRWERVVRFGRGQIHFVLWDAQAEGAVESIIERHKENRRQEPSKGLSRPVILLGFPPCTDLATSGSSHFRSKWRANPAFQSEAMRMVRACDSIADALGIPYATENPVSVISSLWRKPDFTFHPFEFGGWLPEGDSHPTYPKHVAPRDAYRKLTCLWVGNGFVLPTRRPVKPMRSGASHGGADAALIRSLTPRGAFIAIFDANHKAIESGPCP